MNNCHKHTYSYILLPILSAFFIINYIFLGIETKKTTQHFAIFVKVTNFALAFGKEQINHIYNI